MVIGSRLEKLPSAVLLASALVKLAVPKLASGKVPPLHGASTTTSAEARCAELSRCVVLKDLPRVVLVSFNV